MQRSRSAARAPAHPLSSSSSPRARRHIARRKENQAATAWVHHTTQVLVLANLAQDALTDMELRYEEFLRSGDETADAAYEHDANEFPPLLGALAALAESVHSVADVFWRKDGSSAHSADDPGPPRVLVVEDDPGLAGILTEGLAASGVETQHATNSERAIALTSTGNPDLLLVNVALAADSGLQVVDWLRERDQLRRVPVVIYSGRDLSKPEAVHERVMTLLSHFA